MDRIIDKINALKFDEYGAVEYDGRTYLLVFMKYNYYIETDDDNFPVSPYYFASNNCYFAAKELCEYICSLGYMALLDNKSVYDPVLETCGAKRGDNNLFFTEKSGSLFCVHVIITEAPVAFKNVGSRECVHCGRCVSACPMGALASSDMSLCLRRRMDVVGDVMCRDKITTLLGCDVCQKVCPVNDTGAVKASYPEFNRDKIIRGDMTGLRELVGKNMARKTRLQFQAMCIEAVSGNFQRLNSIESALVNDSITPVKSWCTKSLTEAMEKQGKSVDK